MVQIESGSQFGEMLPRKEQKDSSLSFGVYIPNRHRPITNLLIEGWRVLTRSGSHLTEHDISQRTGVERRFWASKDETVVDMGAEAAQEALKGGVVDFVMVSTSFPCGVNVASEIASRLELPMIKPGSPDSVLDIHAACAGFARGLAHLKEFEGSFRGKRILFISTEKYSDKLVDLEKAKSADVDPSLSQTIFSDGAVALYFTYGQDIEILAAETHRFDHIRDVIQMPVDESLMVKPYIYEPVDKSPDYFRQDGRAVYEGVRNVVAPLVDSFVERAGIDPDQIQAGYFHQGSGHILDALQRKIKHRLRLVRDTEDGNFSSGSIPKLLVKEAENGNIDPQKIILIVGFGAGAGLLASIVAVIIKGARKNNRT